MCCTRAKDTQSVRLKLYLKYTHASYCESISYIHAHHSQQKIFSLRMLTLRWPACLPSFSGIWTSCRVTSSLAWCSSDRDNELRDQPSWIRFAESWHYLISFITFDWTNIPHCPNNFFKNCFSVRLQANNDVLAFLSGMPVTRNTKYLDLKNSVF